MLISKRLALVSDCRLRWRGGIAITTFVGRMRQALPDDLALLELAQDHKSPELAALLDVARPTVHLRLAAARARLREVA